MELVMNWLLRQQKLCHFLLVYVNCGNDSRQSLCILLWGVNWGMSTSFLTASVIGPHPDLCFVHLKERAHKLQIVVCYEYRVEVLVSLHITNNEYWLEIVSVFSTWRWNCYSESLLLILCLICVITSDCVYSYVFVWYQVTMYTIIVAEDDSKNASGLEMPSWRDVQAYSVWPPYQVTGICIAAFLNQCL